MRRPVKNSKKHRNLIVSVIGMIPIILLSQLGVLSDFNDLSSRSSEILNGAGSPFRNLFNTETNNEISLPFPRDVRTDAQLLTPTTPFGLGNRVSLNGAISHTVEKGDTLSKIFQVYGASSIESAAIAEAIDDLKQSGHEVPPLRVGDDITLVRLNGEFVKLERHMAGGANLLVGGNVGRGFTATIHEPKILESERTVNGVVRASFSASAADQALPYGVVDDFVDLFSNRVEFRKDFQPGDTFSVVYTEKRTESGELVGTGPIRAASIELGTKFFAAVGAKTNEGSFNYYDEKGQLPGDYFLRYPLQFSRISSVFTTARFHPVLQISRPHNGVDFAAPIGTPVRTIGSGVVLFAGFKPSTGYMVRIQHNDRYTTEYMHLSKIDRAVRQGSRVERGELVGAVGMTGLSTGPHLHFGLFDNGKYSDPLTAKLFTMPAGGGTPKVVLAMLEELKQNHASITTVALNGSVKRPA